MRSDRYIQQGTFGTGDYRRPRSEGISQGSLPVRSVKSVSLLYQEIGSEFKSFEKLPQNAATRFNPILDSYFELVKAFSL